MSIIHRAVPALILGATLSAGCIVKDVGQTWYINPDGTVTWVIHEANVRSDSQATEDRLREEAEYWLAVQQERQPVAMGFRELGATRVKTTVLRNEAPFVVQTEAKFVSLDALGQRIIAAIGGAGYSTLDRSNGKTTWTFVLRDPSALDSVGDPSEGVTDLLESMEHLGVVLVSGRFESAQGFELSGDRRAARFIVRESKAGEKEELTVTLRLEWQ